MVEQHAMGVEWTRPRVRLRLVRPEHAPAPRERLLVEGQGFRLTSERLEAGGHSYPLEEIVAYGTRHASPRLKVPLGVGVGAALAEPALLLQPGSWAVTVALVVATALVFASMVWLVFATDTYWLTVQTPEGERHVLRCQDHQLFRRTVEALSEALARCRPDAPGPWRAALR